MKLKLRTLWVFLRHLGDLIRYDGIDELSWGEWLWKRRIGFKTAWDIARIICGPVNENHVVNLHTSEDGENYYITSDQGYKKTIPKDKNDQN